MTCAPANEHLETHGLRTVPTIVTAKEMRNTQDTRTGFVSCKSGRFELFLVEKMRHFSTHEK